MEGKSIWVVSRDHLSLYEYLCREFEDSPDSTVVLDRRLGERRRHVDEAAFKGARLDGRPAGRLTPAGPP